MNNLSIANKLSDQLSIPKKSVIASLKLMGEDCSIAFIARYRKEQTGYLDEVALIKIRDAYALLGKIEARKGVILKSLIEQEKLTEDLKQQVQNAESLAELEDIYLPYKPKKTTRASIAKAKGLEKLAYTILSQQYSNINTIAQGFINKSKGVETIEDALSGARDIIAELVSENTIARNKLRKAYKYSQIKSTVLDKDHKDSIKYKDFFDKVIYAEKAPSYRVLALFRGERDGILRLKFTIDDERAIDDLLRVFIKRSSLDNQIELAVKDSLKRLMMPSIEKEYRAEIKERADIQAIEVFAKNLRQLLMASPLGEKRVLAIDPGFRSGCKLVCLDKQGNLLHNETIYPHPPQNQKADASTKVLRLVEQYKIEAIAMGNGTAGRETEEFIKKIRFKTDIIAVVVNESGASIYSASALARKEFPEHDITVRGSVSIGRRLMDPLSELVKIDAKSIGVGQYQHDVDANLLKASLDDVVISCVNKVGVELNTASEELLAYVSGIGKSLAEKIILYKQENGAFENRESLLEVGGLGKKTYQQAAGFLRLKNSDNILDDTAVHPESYFIIDAMCKKLACSLEEFVEKKELRESLNLEEFVIEEKGDKLFFGSAYTKKVKDANIISVQGLKELLRDIAQRGKDIRKNFTAVKFNYDVREIKDLSVGMELDGVITNITMFGAFVDIGLKENGLLHRSKMNISYDVMPSDVFSINQYLKVRVLDVDYEKKRIQLGF